MENPDRSKQRFRMSVFINLMLFISILSSISTMDSSPFDDPFSAVAKVKASALRVEGSVLFQGKYFYELQDNCFGSGRLLVLYMF